MQKVKINTIWRFQFIFLPPATKLGQGYIFTGVCDSVHRGGGHAWLLGGHAWLLGGVCGWGVCMGACMVARGTCMVAGGACVVARGYAWLPWGMHGCWGVCVVARGHLWLLGVSAWLQGGVHRAWWDTVNEPAVRILLECILVCDARAS